MSITEPDPTAESADTTDAHDTSENGSGGGDGDNGQEELIFAAPLATDLVFGSGMVVRSREWKAAYAEQYGDEESYVRGYD